MMFARLLPSAALLAAAGFLLASPIAANGMRAQVSISRARVMPLPSVSNSALAGSRTDSKKIGCVSEARQPSFW